MQRLFKKRQPRKPQEIAEVVLEVQPARNNIFAFYSCPGFSLSCSVF